MEHLCLAEDRTRGASATRCAVMQSIQGMWGTRSAPQSPAGTGQRGGALTALTGGPSSGDAGAPISPHSGAMALPAALG